MAPGSIVEKYDGVLAETLEEHGHAHLVPEKPELELGDVSV